MNAGRTPPRMPKPLPPLSVEAAANGFAIMAGDRPWRTPAGTDLVVPTRALAGALAEEIAGVREAGKTFRPSIDALGLTRLAATAIDRIAPAGAATCRALLGFAATDLVCYRDSGASALRARQEAAWQPLLDWLAESFDARLIVVEGIMPEPQPRAALDALAAALDHCDPFTLAGLGLAVQTAGSLAIGLALAHGHIDAAQASALADLDEAFQNEQWGAEADALAKRRLRADDMALAERFLTLLNTPAARSPITRSQS
jgi:chaperone required for assembly of F1-ATPase